MGSTKIITAYEALFRKFQPVLVKYAYTVLRNVEEAKEAVQDVFIKIWQKREDLELNEELKAYLYRATRNHCLNMIKRKRLDMVPLDERYMSLPAEDGKHADRQQKMIQKVYREIGKLPANCREIFFMSRMEGLSHKEIAQILEISPKTVENQIGIALKKIRKGVQ